MTSPPAGTAIRPWRRLVTLLLLGLVSAFMLLGPGPTAAADTTPSPGPSTAEPVPVTLTLFWGDGCPKCAAQREFLDEMQADNPTLEVVEHEVWKNAGNRDLFEEYAAKHDVDASAVPTTFLEDRVWVGWTEAVEDDMRASLDNALAGQPVQPGLFGTANAGTTCDINEPCPIDRPKNSVSVPLIGDVDLASHSLIVSTLVIGFLDGINPCSLWVISILLAIVLRTGSRRRVLAVGSTFLLVTAGMYAIYMAGIYSALAVVGFLTAIRVGVALAAGTFGAISVKDYFWYKRGVSLGIRDESKPGLYARMRTVAQHQSLLPALGATVALAVAVSLLETPCTAGFPVLWTGLLASNDVPFAEAVLLFGLYMVPFLIDEFAVFLFAVVTMRATKMQEHHGRVLKLVSGTIMLALAVVMIVAPQIMEDVVGATAVFVGAALLALGIHLVFRNRVSGATTPPERSLRPG